MTMSRFTILSLMFVIILTVVSTIAHAQDDPEAVIQRYYDALARGDYDDAKAFFADDAVLDGGGGTRRCGGPCEGKSGVSIFIATKDRVKTTRIPIESYPSGSVVTQRVETRNNATWRAGVDRIICWSIWKVKNGKLAFLRHVHDRTDPQTARYIK